MALVKPFQSQIAGSSYGVQVLERVKQTSVIVFDPNLAGFKVGTQLAAGAQTGTAYTAKVAKLGGRNGRILGGFVIGIDANGATLAGGAVEPLGILLNDVDALPFEAQRNGANVATIANGAGTIIAVDVFENGTYAVGAKVYASANGLLTDVIVDPTAGDDQYPTVVGIVLAYDSALKVLTIQTRI